MFVSSNTHNKKIGMRKRFCTTLLCFFRSAIHDKLKIIAEESEIFITMIHTLDITPKTKNIERRCTNYLTPCRFRVNARVYVDVNNYL